MRALEWSEARVLVTGARGFIATHLCRALVATGARVHGVTSGPASLPVSEVSRIQADLADAAMVRRIVAEVNPDVVFHLAGHVTGGQEIGNVASTFAANLTSTVHLLTAASENKNCRVVLAGSMQEPDADDSRGTPCSPYAASKWACAGYARMFHALYGLPVVIARPMMVYGPGQWDTTKLLPYVTTSLLSGTSPGVSSGARQLDWVYVDDVVSALMAVATFSALDGRTIDLGSGTLTSIREIVTLVASLVGSEAPVRFGAVADRPFEQPRAARADETRKLIGWVAETSLSEGLNRTVAWYRQWYSLKPA